MVRGGFGFGLKSIANGMHSHGLIETAWGAGPTDGLGAMVGAWWAASESKRLDCSLGKVHIISEIQDYNEVDCKVMMEIIKYLRTYH